MAEKMAKAAASGSENTGSGGSLCGIERMDKDAGAITVPEIFSLLRPELRRHRRLAAALPLLTLLTVAFSLCLPFLQRLFIDVLSSRDVKMLLPVMAVLGVTMACRGGIEMLCTYLAGRFENMLSLEIRERISMHLLNLPSGFFSRFGGGYLSGRVFEDVAHVRVLFSQQILQLISGVAGIAGGLVMLAVMKWYLVLPLLVAGPVFYLALRKFFRSNYRLHISRSEAYAGAHGQLQQTFSAMRLVKSGAREHAVSRNIRRRMNKLYRIQSSVLKVSTVFGRQIRMLPNIIRLIYLAGGAYLVVREEWTLGFLWAVQGYLMMVMTPVRSLAVLGMQLQQGRAAAARLKQLFGILPEENLDSGRETAHLEGRVDFYGVEFSFDGGNSCLKDVNLHINPGEHVVLMGLSGGGKSTLLSLIPGFFRPKKGEIMIDNVPLEDYNLRSLRQRIGWVETMPEFFDGTLRENLTLGNPEADGAELIELLQALCGEKYAEKFISRLDMPMGEAGKTFSAGEKLRLSIVRELLRKPDILIMDEPSSALDALHETMLLRLLATGWAHWTIVAVSHHAALAKEFDRVLLLENGSISAGGSFDELMESNAGFRHLINGEAG